jgi:hypothetical protein
VFICRHVVVYYNVLIWSWTRSQNAQVEQSCEQIGKAIIHDVQDTGCGGGGGGGGESSEAPWI